MNYNPPHYLQDLCAELAKQWAANRTVNIVCHGHSVPSGYFATPYVNTFDSYPHLLHRDVKEKFPFAVVNVVVTAIGGENSSSGLARFEDDVLTHKPDLVTIDYGLNDTFMGCDSSRRNLSAMIEKCIERNIKVILLTPSLDQSFLVKDERWRQLNEMADMIRALSVATSTALADSFAVMLAFLANGGELAQILSHVNHPNALGHRLIAAELGKWFLAR